jgi:hypothetical protein
LAQKIPTVVNPQTGLPEVVPQIDPATGLPANGSPPFKDSTGTPTWIDPSWSGPTNVLSSVRLEQLPLTEVVRYLREQFKNSFDIILPGSSGSYDPSQTDVDLQLKDVTAAEIFSAMNLQFEIDKTPLRWELTLNGSRPTAMLRYLPQLVPPPPPPPPETRRVFYVGYLLDASPGTNEMAKLSDIANVIQATWDDTGMQRGKINLYPPGQLLIVSGNSDQVDLAEQTLIALKEKAASEKTHLLAQPRISK